MDKNIIEKYKNGATLKELALLMGVSSDTVKRKLEICGVKIRPKNSLRRKGRYNLDFSYFKEINTHAKAYWLGFLFADGNIRKFTTKLKLKDKEPVAQFKEAIQSEHKLSYSKYFDERTKKFYESYSLSVASMEFCSHLTKFGLGSTKYKNYDFPKIDEVFLGSFVRGLFDGDGSICFINKKINKTILQIILSENMTLFLQGYLSEKLGITKRILIKTTKNPNFKLFTMTIGSPSIKFLEWIYKDSTLITRLDRKYQKYLKYKEYLDSPQGIEAIRCRKCRDDKV